MRIGYARVSKADGSQSLDLRRAALRAEGIDDPAHLYHDFASGLRDDRPELDSCLRVLHIPLPIHGLQRSMYKEILGFNATLRRHYVRYGGPKPGRSTECFAFVHDRGTRADKDVTLTIKSTALFQFEASIRQIGEEANTILEGRRVRDSEGRSWETRTTPGASPQRKSSDAICWETLERLLKEAGGDQ